MALIEALPPSSGVTIFGDEAQAIYGFSMKGNGDARHLVSRVRAFKTFEEVTLDRIFRAGSERLAKVVWDGRQVVLTQAQASRCSDYEKLAAIVREGSSGSSSGPGPESSADA